jgi:hypothetical protein
MLHNEMNKSADNATARALLPARAAPCTDGLLRAKYKIGNGNVRLCGLLCTGGEVAPGLPKPVVKPYKTSHRIEVVPFY